MSEEAGTPLPPVDAGRRRLLAAISASFALPSFLAGCGGGGSGSPSGSSSPTPPTADTLSVTFDSQMTSGLTVQPGFLTSSSATNPAFDFVGTPASRVKPLGTSAPQNTFVTGAEADADTTNPSTVHATFYHTGMLLDVIQYGASDNVTLYVDDAFVGRYGLALTSGTAQGGSATTITLAAGSSATSGFYNQYYIRIVAGTGVMNEARQVTAYDSATAIATVSTAWTTTPDATTQYVIQEGEQPFVLDGNTKATRYLHLVWNQTKQRKITIEQGIFAGVASDGSIAPASSAATSPVLVVGDSFWEGESAPINIPRLTDTFAQGMGWVPTNLGQGGTGFVSPDNSANRLNYQDRIAPPMEAWRVVNTLTSGTYRIIVTLNGVSSATSALAFNASRSNVETALNALSNVTAASGSFFVARGDFGTPAIYVGHGIAGATLAFDNTQSAGGTISILDNYTGDVAPNVPTSSTGEPLPFYLLVVGSGNDGGYTDAQVQAAAIYCAQQILQRFPTAMPVFTGVLGDLSTGSDGIIRTGDVSRNAAIAAGAALLPMINGKAAFIDTYANGLGGNKIIYGLGSVADPTPGTNSNLKSITVTNHPTGDGSQFLSNWMVTAVKALLG